MGAVDLAPVVVAAHRVPVTTRLRPPKGCRARVGAVDHAPVAQVAQVVVMAVAVRAPVATVAVPRQEQVQVQERAEGHVLPRR